MPRGPHFGPMGSRSQRTSSSLSLCQTTLQQSVPGTAVHVPLTDSPSDKTTPEVASLVTRPPVFPAPSLPNPPVLSVFGILPSQVVTQKTFLGLCSVRFSKKIISLSLLLIKIAKREEEGRKERGE